MHWRIQNVFHALDSWSDTWSWLQYWIDADVPAKKRQTDRPRCLNIRRSFSHHLRYHQASQLSTSSTQHNHVGEICIDRLASCNHQSEMILMRMPSTAQPTQIIQSPPVCENDAWPSEGIAAGKVSRTKDGSENTRRARRMTLRGNSAVLIEIPRLHQTRGERLNPNVIVRRQIAKDKRDARRAPMHFQFHRRPRGGRSTASSSLSEPRTGREDPMARLLPQIPTKQLAECSGRRWRFGWSSDLTSPATCWRRQELT